MEPCLSFDSRGYLYVFFGVVPSDCNWFIQDFVENPGLVVLYRRTSGGPRLEFDDQFGPNPPGFVWAGYNLTPNVETLALLSGLCQLNREGRDFVNAMLDDDGKPLNAVLEPLASYLAAARNLGFCQSSSPSP